MTNIEDLHLMIEDFNSKFSSWMKKSGMVVKFGWKYGLENRPKELEILGVDKIVWRKPAPEYKSVMEAMEYKKETGG